LPEWQGERPSQFCTQANADGFVSMLKDLDLDAHRRACWR